MANTNYSLTDLLTEALKLIADPVSVPEMVDRLLANIPRNLGLFDAIVVENDEQNRQTLYFVPSRSLMDEMKISIPTLQNIYFIVGNDFFGKTETWEITKGISTDQQKYIEFNKLQFKIGFKNPMLRPVNNLSGYSEIIFGGGVRIYESLEIELLPEQGLEMKECMIGTTGIALSFKDVLPDFSKSFTPEKITSAGYGPMFRGLYAEEGILRLLPGSILHNPEEIKINVKDVFLSEEGCSFSGYAQFDVFLNDDKSAITDAAVHGKIGGFDFAPGLFTIKVLNNLPVVFTMKGFASIPFITGTVFETSVGYQLLEEDNFRANILIRSFTTLMINGSLSGGQPFNLLRINKFTAVGILENETVTINGTAEGVKLNLPGLSSLPGLDVEIDLIDTSLIVSEERISFSLHLEDIPIGIIGTIENVDLHVEYRNDLPEQSSMYASLNAALQWKDLKDKLPQLPPAFQHIVPADDLALDVFLEWENNTDDAGNDRTQIHIKLSAVIDEPIQIRELLNMPAALFPEVNNIMLLFDITYLIGEENSTSNNGVFKGGFSLQADIKLPDFPAAIEGLEFHTGNKDGWITLKASLTGLDTNAVAKCSIEDVISASLILPGLNQRLPNVICSIDRGVVTMEELLVNGNHASKLFAELNGSYFFRLDAEALPVPSPIKQAFDFVRTVSGSSGEPSLKGEVIVTLNLTQEYGGSNKVQWNTNIKCDFKDLAATVNIGDLIRMFAQSNTPILQQVNELASQMDFGCRINSAEIEFNNKENNGAQSKSPVHFVFRLRGELQLINIVIPIYIEITDKDFAIGIEEFKLPLELVLPPIDEHLFDYTSGDPERWYHDKFRQIEEAINTESNTRKKYDLFFQKAILEMTFKIFIQIPDGKANYLRWLNMLAMQYSFALKWANGDNLKNGFTLKGIPYLKLDSLIAGDFKTAFSLDKDAKLIFNDIKLSINLADFRQTSVSGIVTFKDFAKDNIFRILEVIKWELGITSDLIYISLQTPGKVYFPQIGELDGVPISGITDLTGAGLSADQLLEKDKFGFIRIDKAMLGFGFSKRSFAIQFQGEVRLPDEFLNLFQNFQQDITRGTFYLLPPRKTSLYFRFELIPIPAGEIVIFIPYFEFALDMRLPGTPAFISTRSSEPYWDGFQIHLKDVFEADLKHIGFSPIFLGDLAPIIPLSFDIKAGNELNGFTVICDNYIYCQGRFLGAGPIFLPFKFLFDPAVPWVDNIAFNVRFAGFGINLNFQRPLPSIGLDALLELLALMSDPGYMLQPDGSLANSMRIALTDIIIKVPDYAKPFLPQLGDYINKPMDLVVNIASFQNLFKHIGEFLAYLKKMFPGLMDGMPSSSNSNDIEFAIRRALDQLINELTPEKLMEIAGELISCIPIQGRVIGTEINFGGFRTNATIAIITTDELEELVNASEPELLASVEINNSMSLTNVDTKVSIYNDSDFDGLNPGLPNLVFQTRFSEPSGRGSVLFANDFKNFDKESLVQLQTMVSSDGQGILAGTDIALFGQQVFGFTGLIGQFRDDQGKYAPGFLLYSHLTNPKLFITVSQVTIPIPLAINGNLKLKYMAPAKITTEVRDMTSAILKDSGWAVVEDSIERIIKTALEGSGFIEANFTSHWEPLPGVLNVYLGKEVPELVSFGSILINLHMEIAGNHPVEWDENRLSISIGKDIIINPEKIGITLHELVNNPNDARSGKEPDIVGEVAKEMLTSLFRKNGAVFSEKQKTEIFWNGDLKRLIIRNGKQVQYADGKSIVEILNTKAHYDTGSRIFNYRRKKVKDIFPSSDLPKSDGISNANTEMCKIIIDSSGKFLLSGMGKLVFYPSISGLSAILTCESMLALNNYFYSKGNFDLEYQLPEVIGIKEKIKLQCIASGHIGPQDHFSFSSFVSADLHLLGLQFESSFSIDERSIETTCKLSKNKDSNQLLKIFGLVLRFNSASAACKFKFKKEELSFSMQGSFDFTIISFKGTELDIQVQGEGSIQMDETGKIVLTTGGHLIWDGKQWTGAKMTLEENYLRVTGYFIESKDIPLQNDDGVYIKADIFMNVQFELDSMSVSECSADTTTSIGLLINQQRFPIGSAKFSFPGDYLEPSTLQSYPQDFELLTILPEFFKWKPGSNVNNIVPNVPIKLNFDFQIQAGSSFGTVHSDSVLPHLDLSSLTDTLFPKFQEKRTFYLCWNKRNFNIK